MAALGQQGVGLAHVHQPSEQVRDFAPRVPRLVVLEAAAVALQQQFGSAGALDLLGDRQLTRAQRAGEPVILTPEARPPASTTQAPDSKM